jgi:hypothetical protein
MDQKKRIAELERICAELYQVIGSMADHVGCFDHPDVQRALDNASKARLVHRDLTPWPKTPLKISRLSRTPNKKTVAALEKAKRGGGRVWQGTTRQAFNAILREKGTVRKSAENVPRGARQ